ncbi:uncharacterized protein LOC136084425 [Hydra vulgaris]|uniref:Uncharacterized protein LOC136084425 n=1 Tax=Hydra vulgaris TaxID=6087 RepID=A0ABM4CFL5_HYDVU
MDNHESRISIASLNLAKDSGVVLLTLPPHCSHKLQPLDRSVYEPFKRFYNNACAGYMASHPGQPITIYEIAELVGQAFPLAFTAANITSGFRASWIYPFNCDIFESNEFLSSYVTDIENPVESRNSCEVRPDTADHSTLQRDIDFEAEYSPSSSVKLAPAVQSAPSTSVQSTSPVQSAPTGIISPAEVRPFPKVAPRKTTGRRQKGSTRILTDTLEKKALEKVIQARSSSNKRKLSMDSNNKKIKQMPRQKKTIGSFIAVFYSNFIAVCSFAC